MLHNNSKQVLGKYIARGNNIMRKSLIILFTVLFLTGIGCVACSFSYENLNNADLIIFSAGLVGVAFVARKKLRKK